MKERIGILLCTPDQFNGIIRFKLLGIDVTRFHEPEDSVSECLIRVPLLCYAGQEDTL